MISESFEPYFEKRMLYYSQARKKAQIGQFQSAPKIFSTPFPKNRYQILAILWKRCRFFCGISRDFPIITQKYVKFSVLHNAFTAFALHIRGPPQLELLYTNSIDWRSPLWYGIEMRDRIPMKFCKIDLQHICCRRSKDGGQRT